LSNGLDRDSLVQQYIDKGILDVDMKRKICLIGAVNMGLDEQSSEGHCFHSPLLPEIYSTVTAIHSMLISALCYKSSHVVSL
jgi:hypothetical protein